jgi:tRNA G18 (ribose-2'-O)-methylase SpoU
MQHQKFTTNELNRLNKENFKLSDKNDIYIILDQLRSGNNIGSIFRTADAFKLKKFSFVGNLLFHPTKKS